MATDAVFCQAYLQPRVISDYKNEVIDRNIFKEFGNMGILGPKIKVYSCLGESYLTYGLIAKEIEAIDSGYRSMFSVQSSLPNICCASSSALCISTSNTPSSLR